MQQLYAWLKSLSPKSVAAVVALLTLVGGLSLLGVLAFNASIGMHSWLTAQQIWINERKQVADCIRETIERAEPSAMDTCDHSAAFFNNHTTLRRYVAQKRWDVAHTQVTKIGLTRSEADAAVELFKVASAIPQASAAIEVWGEALVEVHELVEMADQIEQAMRRGQVDADEKQAWLDRLDELAGRLAKSEEHFADLLHQAAPWGRYIGVAAIFAALLLLAASGAYLGRVAQLFQEEHALVQRRLAHQEAKMMEADRMIAVGTLAAGVGHEINNPLTYVSGGIDFARRTLRELADDDALADAEHVRRELAEVIEALEDASEGTGRVRDIARDLRTFARHEESQKVEPVDVVPIIELALDMAHHEIRHRATLVRDYADDAVAMGDESRLAQVFLNLVVNAAQAIELGPADENEIEVVTRREDDQIVIEIHDTGKGIRPEDRHIVFEPFRTTKPEGEGTGLGMAISRNIVQSLGGTIEFDSELGVRTVFTVRLPAA